jgi:hypothetical protein
LTAALDAAPIGAYRWVATKKAVVTMQHVYGELPKFCVAFKPKVILVRLPSGELRSVYFGPEDHDERGAELELLHREVDAATRIAARRAENSPPVIPPVAA